MDTRIRPATADDVVAIQALLPRLAAFELPAGREPEQLWRGDEKMLLQWAEGECPKLHVLVAETGSGGVAGVAMVSMRPEMLSGAASAHLEVLAVKADAEGQGLGQRLMAEAEALAQKHGALSMTLHVFANNTRARGFYAQSGYDGELLRYSKALD